MSIVPNPGQMGPGTGLISLGTGLMKHPTLFRGLQMGPALTGLGVGIYLSDLQRARAEGFGDDVRAFRERLADKLIASSVVSITLSIMPDNSGKGLSSSSPGGGGPGGLPNLHRPPPSIEETGEILSNPPMAGGKVQNGHGIDPQFGKWGSPIHAAEWIRDDDGYHWICPTTHRLKKIHGRWMCIKKG